MPCGNEGSSLASWHRHSLRPQFLWIIFNLLAILPSVMKAQLILLASILSIGPAFAGLEPGDKIQLTIRGVVPDDQNKINGEYRVGKAGDIRLPMLDAPVAALGLEAEQFARAAEKAYQNQGIYTKPVIEINILEGDGQRAAALVSVGGNVRRAGELPYRKNMTVLQAMDAAGGRNDFGGRNVLLFREGKQYTLDFNNLAHKNIVLKPGDSLQVEQKGALIDRWKGKDEQVRNLLN